MRDQHELAQKCLEIEEAGGDVHEYLKAEGFISPRATWQRLQLNELRRSQKDVEKGEFIMKGIMTPETEQEAIRIALEGGDPKKYLAQKGSKSPEKLWFYIKTKLKARDPETYDRLPDLRKNRGKKPQDTPPVVKVDGPMTIQAETPEKIVIAEPLDKGFPKAQKEKITKPVSYDGFHVRGIEGEFGTYIYSETESAKYIDYDSKDDDQLSMTIEQWRGFVGELKRAFAVLGVEL